MLFNIKINHLTPIHHLRRLHLYPYQALYSQGLTQYFQGFVIPDLNQTLIQICYLPECCY